MSNNAHNRAGISAASWRPRCTFSGLGAPASAVDEAGTRARASSVAWTWSGTLELSTATSEEEGDAEEGADGEALLGAGPLADAEERPRADFHLDLRLLFAGMLGGCSRSDVRWTVKDDNEEAVRK